MLVFRLMVGEIIKKALSRAVFGNYPHIDREMTEKMISLEHPKDMVFGDYSTPVALSLKDVVSKTPKEIAENLLGELQKNTELKKIVSKIEVAGAGFINFYLTTQFFTNSISEIIKTGKDYGENTLLSGNKIMVEYTDPNPFKEFHI